MILIILIILIVAYNNVHNKQYNKHITTNTLHDKRAAAPGDALGRAAAYGFSGYAYVDIDM